jgi:hypothetical protein
VKRKIKIQLTGIILGSITLGTALSATVSALAAHDGGANATPSPIDHTQKRDVVANVQSADGTNQCGDTLWTDHTDINAPLQQDCVDLLQNVESSSGGHQHWVVLPGGSNDENVLWQWWACAFSAMSTTSGKLEIGVDNMKDLILE